jgi:CarD family transcriptional regulator
LKSGWSSTPSTPPKWPNITRRSETPDDADEHKGEDGKFDKCVPTNKVEAIGMRKLSSDKTLREALDTLKGKPKVKRTMWSRRAQEYEAKINSGDLVSIAEVTRDLFRADDQPEQSYSERQIFEAASSRLARELAAMEKTDEPAALKKILAILNEYAPKYYAEAAATA